ncbi:MAG: hypothetical protein ACE5QV_02020, partial [Fidelibacterota bacterium]
MTTSLELTGQKLGDGTIISLDSGEKIFRLHSYEANPIVKPQDLGLTWREGDELRIGAVFNGGAEFFQKGVILTPRCHRNYHKGKFFDKRLGIERECMENYISEVWPLISEDGINFTRFKDVIIRADGSDHKDFTYGIEDIRITKYDEVYVLIGCGKIKPPFKGSNADRIAIYSTTDFEQITYHEIVESFDSRNAVLFPEPIGGRYHILLRFHPDIYIDILEADLDQLLNPSKHRKYWQKIYNRRSRNLLLEAGKYEHEREKIGPGPPAIKTSRGWLLIYHAVGEIDADIYSIYGLKEKIGRGYSVCSALLDLDQLNRVLCRTRYPIYIPSAPYELKGDHQYQVDVPAVVFPTGA